MAALRVLLLVCFAAAFVGLGTVAQGGTGANAVSGWVAYERESYDQRVGEARWYIAVASADSRAVRNVTPKIGPRERRDDLSPAWSVSGRLAFVRSLLNSTELLIAEPGTWRVRRISRLAESSRQTHYDYAPAWSPDERQIAWPELDSLYIVDVQHRTRARVAGPACRPRWSPDGRSLLYLVGDCADSPEHRRVEVVNAKGGGRRVIARGHFNSADWSTDGRRIAYAGDCESGPGGDPFCGVLLSNADGSQLQRLSLPPGVVDWVRWTDASTIIAGGMYGERTGLVKIDADQRTAAPLASGVVTVWPQAPEVTDDGSIAVVELFGPRGGRPAVVDVGSGAVRWGRTPPGWDYETRTALSVG